MKAKQLFISLVAASCITSSASSAVSLYEGFDYALNNGDSIAGSNGGTGWGGAWAGSHTFATGLTYTNGATLATTGGALADAGAVDYTTTRSYSAGLVGDSGTVWFSYLLQTGSARLEEVKFESDGVRAGVGFGTDNSHQYSDGFIGAELRIETPAQIRDASVSVTGSTMFVLGKMELSSGGDNILSVWLNTDLTLAEGALGAADSTVTINGTPTWGSEFLFTTGGGHEGILDEIRLGSAYSDVVVVVPEPSAFTFIICTLGFALVMRRRRD